MANEEHVSLLKQGYAVWNAWREQHPETRPDLSDANLWDADLRRMNLTRADFNRADLTRADLSRADLSRASLSEANLVGTNLNDASLEYADLSGTDLRGANLSRTDLRNANLSGADLRSVNFSRADLSAADLSDADLSKADLSEVDLQGTNFNDVTVWATHFADLDLRAVKGLEHVRHTGPSYLSTSTLVRSHGDIPEVFLRGVGLDDTFIEYAQSLVSKPIQYYTCFISYASKDKDFANRLYTDLQSQSIRCWFAPHDMPTGAFIRRSIDEAIRKYDKLILILSEASVKSTWVEFETEMAMAKETTKGSPVLFPIRIDEAIMRSRKSWATHIKHIRNIGDFTQWKNHDTYMQAFTRLLNDLQHQQTTKRS